MINKINENIVLKGNFKINGETSNVILLKYYLEMLRKCYGGLLVA